MEEKKRLLYQLYHSHEKESKEGDVDGACLQKGGLKPRSSVCGKDARHLKPDEEIDAKKRQDLFVLALEAPGCRNYNSANIKKRARDDISSSIQDLARPRSRVFGKDARFLKPNLQKGAEEEDIKEVEAVFKNETLENTEKLVLRIKIKPSSHQQPKKPAGEEDVDKRKSQIKKLSSHQDRTGNIMQKQEDIAQLRSRICGKDARHLGPEYWQKAAEEDDVKEDEAVVKNDTKKIKPCGHQQLKKATTAEEVEERRKKERDAADEAAKKKPREFLVDLAATCGIIPADDDDINNMIQQLHDSGKPLSGCSKNAAEEALVEKESSDKIKKTDPKNKSDELPKKADHEILPKTVESDYKRKLDATIREYKEKAECDLKKRRRTILIDPRDLPSKPLPNTQIQKGKTPVGAGTTRERIARTMRSMHRAKKNTRMRLMRVS